MTTIQKRMNEIVLKRGNEKPEIQDYIQAAFECGVIDHEIRANAANGFYIHPRKTDGPTLDFFLGADGQVICMQVIGAI